MRKIDLVNIISDKTGIPKIDVLVTIESLITEIKENMLKGENIYIRGFGSFFNKKKAAKTGRNIHSNTTLQIPERYIPAFKPAPEFTNEIKKSVKSNE